MEPTTFMPPLVLNEDMFPNVFVFPPDRIFDPGGNVLLAANLFNFDINSDRPRRDHDLWLGSIAAKVLAQFPDGGARLVGLASRSGSDAYNMRLSLRRARNVETSLSLFLALHDLTDPPSPPPRVTAGAQGEHFAASLGVADGTEDARWRSVLVTILEDRTDNTPVRLLSP